jgi:hypothetical protein
MKIIKILVLIVVIAILGVVFYLGYLGFVPGLSTIMGTNKPRDLGITYTRADYDKDVEKSVTKIEHSATMPDANKSMVFSGQKDLTQSFTSAEISSRLDYASWAYMPVANTQVRFNGDGTVEFSGNVVMSKLYGFISAIGGVGYTQADIEKGLGYLNAIKTDPPLYFKVKPTVENNKVTLSFSDAQVGKINIPLDQIDANGFMAGVTEQIMNQIPGFYAKSVTITDNQMNFSGTVPEKVISWTGEK